MIMCRFSLLLACLLLLGACSSRRAPATEPTTREYEQMEYLSDHLAIGTSSGTAYLLTAEGEVVATSDDVEALRAGADAAYALFLDEDYTAWESILDQYDSLCNACAARRPADELLGRLESIRAQLQTALGRMDPQQRARFEDIRGRYEKYRR